MKNYGLKLEPIVSDNYIFGSSPLSIPDINESMDWRKYLPKYEPQTLPSGEEDYGCTIWGGQNQLEITLKFITQIEHNFDEQFNYNIVAVEPPGADPQLYYESQRKQGLTEGIFPALTNLTDFKKPRPMTEEYLAEGRKFPYLVNHEWLFTNNPGKELRLSLLKTGLKKSPVAVSVSAWASDANNLYIQNFPNNHWCVCVAIEDECPIVFDSYDQSIKKLHPDHMIQVAKIIQVKKKDELTPEQVTGFKAILKAIAEWLGLIQKQIDALPKNVDKPISPEPQQVYNEVKEAIKPTMIEKWAKAIARMEGDISGVNPGNLKFSPLIEKLGGKKGRKGSDGGYFALFESYDAGFKALCDFLTLACKDQLKSYHTARTFQKFTKIYAGNPPQNYINQIAKEIGVLLDTDISTFLK
jgi:hypothetical protein